MRADAAALRAARRAGRRAARVRHIRVVLVHGGGPQTTALAESARASRRASSGGRRVTSPETLEAVVMTLNGTVNTAVLAACRAASLPAVGALRGGRRAAPREARGRRSRSDLGEGPATVDYGEVGDIVSVDRTVLDSLIAAGYVPVVSPLAADDEGRVLNVNADTVGGHDRLRARRREAHLPHGHAGDPRGQAATPPTLISYTDLPGLGRDAGAGRPRRRACCPR